MGCTMPRSTRKQRRRAGGACLALTVEQFELQGPEEGLHHRVVSGGADATIDPSNPAVRRRCPNGHAVYCHGCLCPSALPPDRQLAFAANMPSPGRRPPAPHVGDRRSTSRRCAASTRQHRGAVELALARGVLGDIGQPEPVGASATKRRALGRRGSPVTVRRGTLVAEIPCSRSCRISRATRSLPSRTPPRLPASEAESSAPGSR